MGRKVFQVFIALVLAYAWLWTKYFQEKGVIKTEWTPWVLAGLGILFLLQQIWINLPPKPKDMAAIDGQRELAQTCLDSLKAQYNALVQAKYTIPSKPIRVNLMLATRRMPLSWHLKIYYSSCSAGTAYSPEEIDALWKYGIGAVGTAWKTHDMVIYDSKDSRFSGPNCTVPADRAFATKSKSILAAPVIRQNRVVAVLALDSEWNIDYTKFHEEEVVRLVRSYVNTIKPLCFSDGVLGKPLLAFR